MLDATRAARARLSSRRLAAAGAAWALVTVAAIGVALALDSPVGAGPRDAAAPAAPGPVAEPDAGGTGLLGRPDLPPLAPVLERSLPAADIAGLRDRAVAGRDPARWTEVGVALQLAGDAAGAEDAYARALRIDPAHIEARVGRAMVRGAAGDGGGAAADLRDLAAAHPGSQIVAMNGGWLDLYRRRPEEARTAFERTVALGRDTRLGRVAAALLDALSEGALGARP